MASAFAKLEQNIKLNQRRIETRSVMDSYRRVLARDIVCRSRIPRFDSSHMDGYAIKAEDIADASGTNPARLNIAGAVETGKQSRIALKSGQAYVVFTGGFLPPGADTIVPQEQAQDAWTDNGGKVIMVRSSLPKGSFVHRAGSDIEKSEHVLAKGRIVKAADIGLLKSLHIFKVPLFAKPRVSVIPTGSELTDDFDTKSGKVLNTNSRVIASLVEETGGSASDLGVTQDSIGIIAKKIRHALATSDMILTIGGSSAGKYDLVDSAVRSICKSGMLAHGVRLDRGRVTGTGALKGKAIIILPGPIQGAVSAFLTFAYPIIRMLAGYSSKEQLIFPAKLTESWQARKQYPDFRKIVYTKLSFDPKEQVFVAQPLHGETESMMLLVRANSYIVVPENTISLKVGQKVVVSMLPSTCSFL